MKLYDGNTGKQLKIILAVLIVAIVGAYGVYRNVRQHTPKEMFEDRTNLQYPPSARAVYFRDKLPMMQDPDGYLVFDTKLEEVKALLAEKPFGNLDWEYSGGFDTCGIVATFGDTYKPPAVAHWAFNVINSEIDYLRRPHTAACLIIDENKGRVWLYFWL